MFSFHQIPINKNISLVLYFSSFRPDKSENHLYIYLYVIHDFKKGQTSGFNTLNTFKFFYWIVYSTTFLISKCHRKVCTTQNMTDTWIKNHIFQEVTGAWRSASSDTIKENQTGNLHQPSFHLNCSKSKLLPFNMGMTNPFKGK